ncbi:AMP-binding enzyme [Nocardioides terrisoli]|uniref:AMP-binding enzyme n=1 Tax=Nocardioides terrisoli TaxID=3388267 RepID=UPI00287B90B8|nr:o-succinylbenzoate--CoA ligase [Nocardioides marmorisolisilvae]
MSTRSAPEPVAPDRSADPVAAVLRAHRTGADLVLRTSGSSGTAQPVVRSTQSWWASFGPYSDLTGVSAGARVWVPGPLSATMNLFAAVHARAVGAILVDRPADASHACLTPALLDRRADDLRPGTHVVVAGAALPPGQHAVASASGLEVVSYYGAAELSFVAAGPHAESLRAFPGVEVEVRAGAIWVRSPYVAAGGNQWATVGDRGRLADGVLTVLGRPGTVTTAGATVRIADVEAALRPAATSEFVVVGAPHPVLGEVLAAAVTSVGDRDRLRALARTALPASHRPRLWRVLDQLPLTAAGKVDRARIADDL